MDEDDIYGEEIYGTTAYTRQDAAAGTSNGYQNSGYAAEIQALEKTVAEREKRCAELEAHLKAALAATDQWKAVVKEAMPSSAHPSHLQDASLAAQELKRMRMVAEKPGNENIGTLRQKEAALQMQLAEKNMGNIDLQTRARTARQCADPNIAQVKQLLLDTAVQKEFDRMKAELEKAAREMKGLQEELQAVQFSQDSKAGRMLMAKCRALQDENEEMGKELAEGKVHALERQVALSKTYVEDMRARYLELEDHSHALENENEDIHQQVFSLRRQLREAEMRSVPGVRERGIRPMNSGGRFGQQGPGLSIPGPPARFEGNLSSPDGDRKRGLPLRDTHPGAKRLR